ncbi:MAG: WD40 domain-containing protein [Planctomycetes bacterium]|nr:WD40 domain-containing protein [Planctomycetota bacterium]
MLTWQAHTGAVTSLAFVPGGGLLSTGADGLKRWDTLSGVLQDEWHLGRHPVTPAFDNGTSKRNAARSVTG